MWDYTTLIISSIYKVGWHVPFVVQMTFLGLKIIMFNFVFFV